MTVLSALFLVAALWTPLAAQAQDGVPPADAPSAEAPPAEAPPAEAPPADAPPADAPPEANGEVLPTPPKSVPGTATGPPPLGDQSLNAGNATVASPRPSTATFPTASTGDNSATLYLGAGAAMFMLLGVVWVWSRRRDPAELPLPTVLTRLPEPALIAAPLPSLSDGLQHWSVADDDQGDMLVDILSTLAQRHRVLVVCSANIALPRVAGGPVFRVDGMRPIHLEDPVHQMDEDGGRPVCVLLVPPHGTEGAIPEFADTLPPQVGGIVLSTAELDLPLPKVVAARSGEDGWTLATGHGSVDAKRTSRGHLTATTSA